MSRALKFSGFLGLAVQMLWGMGNVVMIISSGGNPPPQSIVGAHAHFGVLGILAIVVGFAVAALAGLDLGVEETQGLPGELRTDGWYRFSRNPQYVGYLLATVAFPVWTGAPLVAPLCGIYVVWWLCFPLAEEPWLREQYGAAYERYAGRVPRFVGRQTLRAMLGRDDGESSPSRS